MTDITTDVDRTPARFRGATGTAYRAVLGGSIVGLAYLVVLAAYLVSTEAAVLDPTRATYPLVWLALSGAALSAITPHVRPASVRRRWAGVAGAYVFLLAGISGQIAPELAGFGVDITTGLPGWGPVVAADLLVATVVVVPFQTLGYLVLGVLLARALSAYGGSLVAGGLGLFSCAGCMVPLLTLGVSAGSLPLLNAGYALSTVAFGCTLLLLVVVICRGSASAACEC